MEGISHTAGLEGGDIANLEARIRSSLDNIKKNIAWLEEGEKSKGIKERAVEIYFSAQQKLQPLLNNFIDPHNPDSPTEAAIGFLRGGVDTILNTPTFVVEHIHLLQESVSTGVSASGAAVALLAFLLFKKAISNFK